MSSAPTIAAGWYADPTNPSAYRWWDGAAWTDHVHQPDSVPPAATTTTAVQSHVASATTPAPAATAADELWPDAAAGFDPRTIDPSILRRRNPGAAAWNAVIVIVAVALAWPFSHGVAFAIAIAGAALVIALARRPLDKLRSRDFVAQWSAEHGFGMLGGYDPAAKRPPHLDTQVLDSVIAPLRAAGMTDVAVEGRHCLIGRPWNGAHRSAIADVTVRAGRRNVDLTVVSVPLPAPAAAHLVGTALELRPGDDSAAALITSHLDSVWPAAAQQRPGNLPPLRVHIAPAQHVNHVQQLLDPPIELELLECDGARHRERVGVIIAAGQLIAWSTGHLVGSVGAARRAEARGARSPRSTHADGDLQQLVTLARDVSRRCARLT